MTSDQIKAMACVTALREVLDAAREELARYLKAWGEAEAEIARLKSQEEATSLLLDQAEQRRRELEVGLASKIGPDWREALPYETEIELADCIKKLKQQVWDITKGRDDGWARVAQLEHCLAEAQAALEATTRDAIRYQDALKEAQAALRRIVDAFTSDSYDNSEESQRRLHNHVYSIAKAALAPPPPETRGM